MAIDPKLYEKYSGRSGDPYKRLGEALAKSARVKSERDGMPKGVSGGFRMMAAPGMFAQLFNWFRNSSRYKGD
jgi:hypothetical protein